MGLVDGDQHRWTPCQQLRETGHRQPLRGDEQIIQIAGQIVPADLPGTLAIAAGVNTLGPQSELAKPASLVLHQRDERRDHQRGTAAGQPRQLIAQRLAGAGRHDQQHIAAAGHVAADRFLMRSEPGQTKHLAQQTLERIVGFDGDGGGSGHGSGC